ncbi:PREDICTED: tyrosyl-DNA phosphodiesterase 1 isoform X2 [Camelina sativa]|uniref:Tyrosyl-DNA phosphodiesterase 1 isoform X2 n=1 Tax=Camelina sativa TaxID=90675 RepID=A0ABM0XXC1_CAMSA|nr:PREDICTED: tyrosyl-DNA phosphodiesterase 1 isoform X2 [Camelina sativa]
MIHFNLRHLSSSMAHSQVAYLIPLKADLKEDDSSPRITLSEGPNIIGRGNVSIADKRLSRKHISIIVSSSGSVSLSEGTNPVVIRSSGDGERKKIKPREEVLVSNDDLIELIPGHHFFKLVLLPTENRGCHERAAKKARKGEAQGDDDDDVEAIRRFVPPNEILPSTFRLLSVNGLPDWANTSCVSINDVIEGDVVAAILSNYMVDVDWLMSACPKLANIPQVMVIHGEGDGRQEYIQRKKPANWSLHKPRLPISFGTHHSKAIFLVYPRGVRVVVHTANLIHVDWNNKSQGLWMQDFPWKDDDNKDPPKCCGFEGDLIDYLNVLKWPEFTASLPGRGNVKINAAFFKKFDYSNATVRLIASVPGYHTGLNLKKWGHMKLRSILQECIFDREFRRSPLVYQFSSLGSLDEKWLAEFRDSLSSGITEDKTPLGPGDPLIIWPTVEDVRCSLEGYAAGNAIPSPLKNVEKPFLKKYWAKWKADHSARSRAMPHIKTFTRYSDQKLAWFLLTSSNLSKAAWGALQKNNSQLMIRSYELGVLFLPSPVKTQGCKFSCTEDNTSTMKAKQETKDEVEKRSKLVTMSWQGNRDSPEIISLPIPYQLPPKPYSTEDVPWSWDRGYSKKDVYGQVWPR